MIDNPPDRLVVAPQPTAPQPEASRANGNIVTDVLGATGITGLLGGLMKTLVGINELDKGNMNPLMSMLEGKPFAPTGAEMVTSLQQQTQANQERRNAINDTFKQAWLQSTTEQNRLNNEIKKTQVNQGQQKIDAAPIAAALKNDKVAQILSMPGLTAENLIDSLNTKYPNEKDVLARTSAENLIRQQKGWPAPLSPLQKFLGMFSSQAAPSQATKTYNPATGKVE